MADVLQILHGRPQTLAAATLASNHAKLIVMCIPNALKMELAPLSRSSFYKLQNLRQSYFACF